MSRRVGNFWQARDGSAAVEFGIIAAPFLVLIFGALQLFILVFAQQILETSAEEAGRLVLTGKNPTPAQFRTAVCKGMPAILDCAKVMVDVQVATSFANADTSPPALTYDKDGKVTNTWQYDIGNSGDVVVMRLMYRWPMMNLLNFNLGNLSDNSRLLMATSVFRNE